MPSPKYSQGSMDVITNGVQGAESFKVHWLGWEGIDFNITLDLGETINFQSISIGTLWDAKSWILHPMRVSCMVSADSITWYPAGTSEIEGMQQKEDVTKNHVFTGEYSNKRYVRFYITGTKKLPSWHPSAGGLSWVFVDEIVVK